MVTYKCPTHGLFYVNKTEVKYRSNVYWNYQKTYECPFQIKNKDGGFVRVCDKTSYIFSKWHNPKAKCFGKNKKKRLLNK